MANYTIKKKCGGLMDVEAKDVKEAQKVAENEGGVVLGHEPKEKKEKKEA